MEIEKQIEKQWENEKQIEIQRQNEKQRLIERERCVRCVQNVVVCACLLLQKATYWIAGLI